MIVSAWREYHSQVLCHLVKIANVFAHLCDHGHAVLKRKCVKATEMNHAIKIITAVLKNGTRFLV